MPCTVHEYMSRDIPTTLLINLPPKLHIVSDAVTSQVIIIVASAAAVNIQKRMFRTSLVTHYTKLLTQCC